MLSEPFTKNGDGTSSRLPSKSKTAYVPPDTSTNNDYAVPIPREKKSHVFKQKMLEYSLSYRNDRETEKRLQEHFYKGEKRIVGGT